MLFVAYSLLAAGLLGMRAVKDQPLVHHPILILPFLLAGLSWLQSVPLPTGLVTALSPQVGEAQAAIALALGGSPEHTPLSVDALASRAAALRWWMVGAGLLAVAQLAQMQAALRRTHRLIIGLALFLPAVGLLHAVAGTTAVYGLVTPEHINAAVGWSGPFINPNHASHFLLLGAALTAHAVSRSNDRSRTLLMLVHAVCVIGMIANGSRGALLAIAIVDGGFAITAIRRGQAQVLAAAAALVLAVGGLWSLGSERVRDFLTLADVEDQLDPVKLQVQAEALETVAIAPLVGLGADAFGAVQVSQVPVDLGRPVHLTFIESDPLQLLLDFGLLGLGLIGLLVGLSFRARSRRPSPPEASIWALVAAYTLYGLFNFTTPVPGLLLPFLAVIVISTGRPRAGHRPARLALLVLFGVVSAGLFLHAQAGPGAAPDPARPLESAMSRPLDGRWLLRVAATATDPGLSDDNRRALVERAVALAGNDATLFEAAGMFYAGIGDLDSAWVHFGLALVAHDQGASQRVERWLGLGGSAALFEATCLRDEQACGPILTGLMRRGEVGLATQVAVALPDSALAALFRTWGNAALGHDFLAESFLSWFTAQPQLNATECHMFAHAEQHLYGIDRGLDRLESCLGETPHHTEMLNSYLKWALDTEERATARVEGVARHLAALNVESVDDPALRREYHRLDALQKASGGRCDLATSAFARGGGGYVPAWLRARCPNLSGD